jgi:hypothetical protein
MSISISDIHAISFLVGSIFDEEGLVVNINKIDSEGALIQLCNSEVIVNIYENSKILIVPINGMLPLLLHHESIELTLEEMKSFLVDV